MIALIYAACVVGSSPTECETKRIWFEGGPTACAVHGQQAIARQLRPGVEWEILEYRCLENRS